MSDTFQKCEEADKDTRSGPHAWIQWKGTQVCMDLHCTCGEMSHVDGDFTYFVSCPHCNRVYAMCANIRMIEIRPEEVTGYAQPVRGT